MNENELSLRELENLDYCDPILALFNNAVSKDGYSDMLRTDITKTENGYRFDVEVPGFEKNNIKVSLEHGYLTVEAKGEKTASVKGKKIRSERKYGDFTRSFYVGDEVSKKDISAEIRKGVLTIYLNEPKKAEPQDSSIEVR